MPRKARRLKEAKTSYRAKRKPAAEAKPITVALRPDVAASVRAEAEHRRVGVDELVNEWLENQLWEEQGRKIEEESKRYQAMHAQLRTQYADKVIAMHEGEAVDSGDEFMEVYRRVRARFGNAAVLITRVGIEPIETYTIRSPRLVEWPTDAHSVS
jgi:hypothetical protein